MRRIDCHEPRRRAAGVNIPRPKAVREADALDIMGTILFKPNQAFGEGLFFDNRECKERRLANMPTRALAF